MTQKWADLEIKELYTVTNTRMVDTQNAKVYDFTLLNNGDVWVPEHLKHRIINSDNHYNPPFYIISLGLNPYKSNHRNKYRAYDIVVNQSKSSEIKQFVYQTIFSSTKTCTQQTVLLSVPTQ